MNNDFDKVKGAEIIFPIICAVILCFSPWVFTRPSICEDFNFSNTGEIGDTIGGITAPFIGVISIILLWITFREQRRFNQQQVNDNTINHVLTLQNNIVSIQDDITHKLLEDNHNPDTATETIHKISSILLLCEQILMICRDRFVRITYKSIFYKFCDRCLSISKSDLIEIESQYRSDVSKYSDILYSLEKGLEYIRFIRKEYSVKEQIIDDAHIVMDKYRN